MVREATAERKRGEKRERGRKKEREGEKGPAHQKQ